MRKGIIIGAVIWGLVLAGCGGGKTEVQTVSCPAETVASTAVHDRGEVTGYFCEAFLKEAMKDGGNFVVSPLSAELALNMAALGAEEGSRTERELLDLFGHANQEEMKERSKAAINGIGGGASVSNSVWVSYKLGGLKSGYSSELKDIFGAESFSADLSSDKFVNELNQWVNKNTNGLIPALLEQPLGGSARLALVNALYFKNEWVNKFDPNNTYDCDFYGTDGTVSVHTMHGSLFLEYAEGSRLRSVKLPYKDGSEIFIADRPFVYEILSPSGDRLFMGYMGTL